MGGVSSSVPSEVDSLRERLLAARAEFRQIPVSDPERLGEPDPATGERWNRGNVLGHMSNILPFWSGQISAALEGATWIGRGEGGYERRRQAIDSGREVPEEVLRSDVEKGLDQVLELLDRIRPEDLDLEFEHRRATETKRKSVRVLLDELLVKHFEDHVRQLSEIS